MTTKGAINFYFDRFAQRPEFADVAKRQEYLNRLNQPPGVLVGPDRIEGRPSISLDTLGDGVALQRLKDSVTWFLGEIPAPEGSGTEAEGAE